MAFHDVTMQLTKERPEVSTLAHTKLQEAGLEF
jgi:hypothetical protein